MLQLQSELNTLLHDPFEMQSIVESLYPAWFNASTGMGFYDFEETYALPMKVNKHTNTHILACGTSLLWLQMETVN